MPSNDEINAGFDAAMPDLHQLIRQFVPFMFQSQAEKVLGSTEGRKDVVALISKVLTAAEGARSKPK